MRCKILREELKKNFFSIVPICILWCIFGFVFYSKENWNMMACWKNSQWKILQTCTNIIKTIKTINNYFFCLFVCFYFKYINHRFMWWWILLTLGDNLWSEFLLFFTDECFQIVLLNWFCALVIILKYISTSLVYSSHCIILADQSFAVLLQPCVKSRNFCLLFWQKPVLWVGFSWVSSHWLICVWVTAKCPCPQADLQPINAGLQTANSQTWQRLA